MRHYSYTTILYICFRNILCYFFVAIFMEDTQEFDSWVQEQERILHIECNNVREPLSQITCQYIYININQYIDRVVKDSLLLDVSGCIPFMEVLAKVKSKCSSTVNTKYVFKESLLFLIDLEPEHVQEFSQLDHNDVGFLEYSKRFMKVLSPVEDIHVGKSIFIFHPLNTLYILLQEVPHKHKREPKSILKTRKCVDTEVKKKVTIKLRGNPEPCLVRDPSHTRKRRANIST